MCIQGQNGVTNITDPNFRGLPKPLGFVSMLAQSDAEHGPMIIHKNKQGVRFMSAPQDLQSPTDRIANIASNGQPFDHETIRSVWEKAVRQPGFETFCLDHHGTSINMFEYSRRSLYGWVIAHIVPPGEGGSDDISNLRPLHWKHLETHSSTPHSPSKP